MSPSPRSDTARATSVGAVVKPGYADSKDDQLESALQDSFPTSDPPAVTQPGVTGWDVDEKAAQDKAGKGD